MSEPLDTVRDWLVQSLPQVSPVVIFGKRARLDEPRPTPPYVEIHVASRRSLAGDLGIITTDEDAGGGQVNEKANHRYLAIVRASFYGDTAAEDVQAVDARRERPDNEALFVSRKVRVGEPASILDLSAMRSTDWDVAVQVDYPVLYRVQEIYPVDYVDTYDVDTTGVTP